MLSNTSLVFISDMGVTGHRHYDWWCRTENRDLQLQEWSTGPIGPTQYRSFRKLVISLETYMKQTVISRLCCIEDLKII